MGFTSLVPETPNTRTFFGAHDGEVAHHHDPRHRLAVVARHWSCMQSDWGRHEGTVVGQTRDKHSVSECLANRLLCACMRSWSSHANCKVCRVVMQEQNACHTFFLHALVVLGHHLCVVSAYHCWKLCLTVFGGKDQSVYHCCSILPTDMARLDCR